MSTYSTISKSSAVNKPASNIFDGQYFEIVLKEADTLVVRWVHCQTDRCCINLSGDAATLIYYVHLTGATFVDQTGPNYVHQPNRTETY